MASTSLPLIGVKLKSSADMKVDENAGFGERSLGEGQVGMMPLTSSAAAAC